LLLANVEFVSLLVLFGVLLHGSLGRRLSEYQALFLVIITAQKNRN
jgi:hypothetical protein